MRSSSSIPPKAPPTGFSTSEKKASPGDSARAQVPSSPRVPQAAAIGSPALNFGKAPSLVTQPPTETPEGASKKFDSAQKSTHDLLEVLQKKQRIAPLRTRAINNAVKNFYAAVNKIPNERTDDSLLRQLFKLELIGKTQDERDSLALAVGNDVRFSALNSVLQEFRAQDEEDNRVGGGERLPPTPAEPPRSAVTRLAQPEPRSPDEMYVGAQIKNAIAGILEQKRLSALVAMSAAGEAFMEIDQYAVWEAALAAEVNALGDTELLALHSFLHGAFADGLRGVAVSSGEPNQPTLMLFTMNQMTDAVDATLVLRRLTARQPEQNSSSSGPLHDATNALVEAFGDDWQASEEPQRPIAPARAPAGLAQLPKDLLKNVGALLPTADLDALSKSHRAPKAALAEDLMRRRVKAFSDYWRARAKKMLPSLADDISKRNWRAVTGGLLEAGFSLRAAEVAQKDCDPDFACAFMVEAGRAQDALQLATEFLRGEPVDPFEIYLERARAFLLLGYPVAAASDLGLAQQALQMANEPDSQEAELMMLSIARAMTWHSQRHFDTAESTMKSVADQVTTHGDDDLAGFPGFIAEAYAWMGDVDNAVAWMEKAMKEGHATLLPLSPFARNIPADNPLWSELRRAAEEHLRATEPLLPRLPRRPRPFSL